MHQSEHAIADQILDLLDQNGYWHENFNHPPVRTSEEAAALRSGYSIAQGAKAIIAKIKIPNQGKSFIMLVFPGNKRFADKKVFAATGAKELRFATEEEVVQLTDGIQPGGVPPFGNLFNLPVICDQSLLNNEKIIFNAGRTTSIAMTAQDYLSLVKPKLANIV